VTKHNDVTDKPRSAQGKCYKTLSLYYNNFVTKLANRMIYKHQLFGNLTRIIFKHISYREALSTANCTRLNDNRKRLCLIKLFQKIETRSDNKLNSIIYLKAQTRLNSSNKAQYAWSAINFQYNKLSCNKLSIFKCNTDS
jgi:hypothetical protein